MSGTEAVVRVSRVAHHILKTSGGPMSTMKLQKLCYFAQGWSLAWTDAPLFIEDFQAWKNGPVCYELFDLHRGRYSITDSGIEPTGPELGDWQLSDLESAIEPYLPLTGAQLSTLTHESGTPWAEARAGVPLGARSQVEITKESMRTFFQALMAVAD